MINFSKYRNNTAEKSHLLHNNYDIFFDTLHEINVMLPLRGLKVFQQELKTIKNY